MKILYVTTIGATMNFFIDFIEELIADGHTVDIATNDSVRKVPDCFKDFGCRVFSLPCSRSPIHKGNLDSIAQIRKLVETEDYDIVHCHTPIAAFCTRLACRKLRKTQGVKVFYTAHGFHFYKGAPFKNWLLYYPAEKICAKFTDVLITINKEDYELAKNKFKAKEIRYVPGVGVDVSKFQNVQVDRNAKRREIGVPEDAFLLFSVGELNENKNHQIIINALAKLNNPKLHYAIAGMGDRGDYLTELANTLGIKTQIHLLGFRNDIAELNYSADVFCFPSFREGLSVSLMEAMSAGLPCVVSRIRGNTELIDLKGGKLFDPHSVEECFEAIKSILESEHELMIQHNREKIKNFSQQNVLTIMKSIYTKD